MHRLPGESFLDYKQRVMDKISPTYCGAKWFAATIWLGSGQTTSCHHPPPHQIPLEELSLNPSALHNTEHKKIMRAQMLAGEKPKECEYCWKIEGLSKDKVSDRIHKTETFSDADNQSADNLGWKSNAPLKLLEIAFDRTCQFACSYCNSGYSTKWAQDIKQNGPYENMQSDGAGAYWHTGSWAESGGAVAENPYVQAFWKWWPELSQTLEEFKVTGGEPLMSPHYWKFLDIIQDQLPNEKMLFSVNSNLGFDEKTIYKFLEKTAKVQKLGVYTSCDADGVRGEYIRDGLNYDQYCRNIEILLESQRLFRLQFMVTVSALTLYGLTEWLDQVLQWKEKYSRDKVAFGLTILRFPSFMSPSTLPTEMRLERAAHIKSWYARAQQRIELMPHESETILRLISYLEEVESPHHLASDLEKRRTDFKMFFEQYDQRRGKSFRKTFPQDLVSWYEGLPLYRSSQKQELFDGSAATGYHNAEELGQIKKRLGLNFS